MEKYGQGEVCVYIYIIYISVCDKKCGVEEVVWKKYRVEEVVWKKYSVEEV